MFPHTASKRNSYFNFLIASIRLWGNLEDDLITRNRYNSCTAYVWSLVTNYDWKTFEKLYGVREIVNNNIYFMIIIKFIVIKMHHRIPKLIKLIGNNVLIF